MIHGDTNAARRARPAGGGRTATACPGPPALRKKLVSKMAAQADGQVGLRHICLAQREGDLVWRMNRRVQSSPDYLFS